MKSHFEDKAQETSLKPAVSVSYAANQRLNPSREWQNVFLGNLLLQLKAHSDLFWGVLVFPFNFSSVLCLFLSPSFCQVHRWSTTKSSELKAGFFCFWQPKHTLP